MLTKQETIDKYGWLVTDLKGLEPAEKLTLILAIFGEDNA